MTLKSLPQLLLLLGFSLSPPVMADSNVLGDEIIVLDEDANLSLSTQLSALPVEQPDNDPGIAAATDVGDVWQRIRQGYALSEQASPHTATHLSWYAARPDYIHRMLERSRRYLYFVVEEVEKRGMPTEIALLPMVESAYNPQAYSRSHASGLWQFMPQTGRHFGLEQNWWADNRRNITAATDAALDYLQKLHVMFGTWDLALAAYNAGEGTVMRAIERNRKRGLPTDYAHLPLPEETVNYVPKLQAIKNLMTHPERFGIEIAPLPNQPYFTRVAAPQQIDARVAAELAGISLEEFSALNPAYNRPVLASNGSPHEILLPIDAAPAFVANLADYDRPLVNWQTYHAKRGERMAAIASKFDISLGELRSINGLAMRNTLASAKALLVPKQQDAPVQIAVNDHAANPVGSAGAAQPSRFHIVKRGENLQLIAKRYGMQVKQLMALNKLKNSRINASQKLLILADAEAASRKTAHGQQATHYVVKRGDTLGSIARRFDIALDDLQRWNNIKGSRIVPGHKLTILAPDEA